MPAAGRVPSRPRVSSVADQRDRQLFGDEIESAKTRPRPIGARGDFLNERLVYLGTWHSPMHASNPAFW
jgi:hypothetical protein